MPLLTTSYNPEQQTAWAQDVIRLSTQMEQEKARMEEAQRLKSHADMVASLQDQRRAFEFDRRLEFDRARTAADDAREDDRLDMQKQIFRDERAPFVLPASASGSTASHADSVPALPDRGGFGASANPSPGFSFAANDSTDGFQTAEGSVFGMVPDGAGGFKNDPNDVTDAGVPGFSANKGAWGANIKDPSVRGVALTPAEMSAAGVNMDDPSGHEVEVKGKDGQTHRFPIVDKLGKAGRIDFTASAYQELGGPMERNGGTIPNVNYRIVPKGAASAAQVEKTGESPADTIINTFRNVQAAGFPLTKKIIQTSLPSMMSAAVSAQARADAKRATPVPTIRVGNELVNRETGEVVHRYTPDAKGTTEKDLSLVKERQERMQQGWMKTALDEEKALAKLPKPMWPWGQPGKYYWRESETDKKGLPVKPQAIGDDAFKAKMVDAQKRADSIAAAEARIAEYRKRAADSAHVAPDAAAAANPTAAPTTAAASAEQDVPGSEQYPTGTRAKLGGKWLVKQKSGKWLAEG